MTSRSQCCEQWAAATAAARPWCRGACVSAAGARLREHELAHRAVERAVGLRPPQNRVLNLACQGEVFIGDSAGGVRGQLDPELPPRDVEVGVMTSRLAEEAHGVYGHQSCRPAVGVVLAPDPLVLVVPLAEAVLRQLRGDLPLAVCARLIACCAHARMICPE